MKNWLTAGTGQTFRRWSLRIIGWGLGIPAGWWIVSTSYRLQQSWTDSRFVAIYLFLYVAIALLAFGARTRDSHLPSVTLWGLCVFAGVGLGRLLWAMVQQEYGTGVEIPLRGTLLTLFFGSASLITFFRWEWVRDRRLERARNPQAAAPVLVVRRPTASRPMQDDVAWW